MLHTERSKYDGNVCVVYKAADACLTCSPLSLSPVCPSYSFLFSPRHHAILFYFQPPRRSLRRSYCIRFASRYLGGY